MEQLRVEEALTRYSDGEIDAPQVDDVIHRYSKATRALWRFCWSTSSGSQVVLVPRTLEHWAAESDAIDWLDEAKRPRRRLVNTPASRPAVARSGATESSAAELSVAFPPESDNRWRRSASPHGQATPSSPRGAVPAKGDICSRW
jgi:hypothetical protein